MGAQERARIMAHLVSVIGEEAASGLMAELGRSDDIAEALERLRAETHASFAQVDQRFTQVDQRFTDLEQRMDERFEEVHGWIEASEARVLAAVRGELVDAVARQTRTMAFTLVGALAGLSGLAYTLSTLA